MDAAAHFSACKVVSVGVLICSERQQHKSSVQNPEPSPTGWSIGVPILADANWCNISSSPIFYQVVQPPIIIGSTRCCIKHPQLIYLRPNQFMLRSSLDFWFRPGGVLDRDMAPCRPVDAKIGQSVSIDGWFISGWLCWLILIGGWLVVHCWVIGGWLVVDCWLMVIFERFTQTME